MLLLLSLLQRYLVLLTAKHVIDQAFYSDIHVIKYRHKFKISNFKGFLDMISLNVCDSSPQTFENSVIRLTEKALIYRHQVHRESIDSWKPGKYLLVMHSY